MPVLVVKPGSRQPAWQQVADTIGNAIRSGTFAVGEALPSVREMSDLQGVRVATLQHTPLRSSPTKDWSSSATAAPRSSPVTSP